MAAGLAGFSCMSVETWGPLRLCGLGARAGYGPVGPRATRCPRSCKVTSIQSRQHWERGQRAWPPPSPAHRVTLGKRLDLFEPQPLNCREPSPTKCMACGGNTPRVSDGC